MKFFRLLGVLFLGALLLGPGDLNSCAVEPLQAVFTAETPREGPDRNFAKGELGILMPQYPRAFLTVAYLYLNGGSLNADQIAKLGPQPSAPATYIPSGAQDWRDALTHLGMPVVYINPYKEDSELHLFYENCKDDAFRSAAAALAALIKAYGPTSDRVKQWVAAQDMVFQNCSAGPAIPSALADSADALAKADRAYQIAAAHFYSGQYEAARTEFGRIGNDPHSPWRSLGPYLVARTMIRQGDLKAAEQQVQSILKDPRQADGHERADHLAAWIRVRLYPLQQMSEAAQAVIDPHAPDFQQSLKDYTYLFDQLERLPGALDKVAETNDLTDWIIDFQHSDAVEGHALERWRATHSTPWLIAALAARPGDAAARAELLKAADKLTPHSPAYLTAQYNAVAMLEGAGTPNSEDNAAARARVDLALGTNPPTAARNLLLAAHMRVARTWAEFMKDAQRTPVTMEGYDYSVNGPTPSHSVTEIGFDADAIYVFNHFVPLAKEAETAHDDKLPPDIRRELATAAWTKAVLLNQLEIARKLAPQMAEFYPGMHPDLADLFAAVFTMLHNPGLRPYPETGFGRLMKINRIDDFRDNWWCKTGNDGQMSATLLNLYGQEKPRANFLPAAERDAAKQENDELSKLPPAPEWMAAETLKFAKAHLSDPRVPEALHLVVRASRYGCVSPHTAEYSKAAFELLHTQFPHSEWSKATPYWFSN